MKYPFLLAAFCLIMTFLGAQSDANEKMTIGIIPFIGSSQCGSNVAGQVYSTAYVEFVNSGRANFVEREDFTQLEVEKLVQAGEGVDVSSIINFDRSQGATYIIVGRISRCDATRKYNKTSGTNYYEGNVQALVKVIEVETGLIHKADLWGSQSGIMGLFKSGRGDTADDALANAAGSCKKSAQNFIRSLIRLDGKILEMKDNKEAYISLGSAHGIKKGDKIFAYVVKTIAGRRTEEKLGELKVTEVNGEDICTAKIMNAKAFANIDYQALSLRTK
ncbi:MAG: hypothetical protein AAFN92_11260 [Bacteroidota bacterium]